MESPVGSVDPLSRVRAYAMLGVLTRVLGVTHVELARGVSEAQLRSYLDGRSDVSDATARRIWQTLVGRVLLTNDERVTTCFTERLQQRANDVERMAGAASQKDRACLRTRDRS